MKKMMAILGVLLVGLGTLGTLNTNADNGHIVHAQVSNLPIGDFIVTKPVNKATTIYISKEMVPFVEATGAVVHTITYTTGWWPFITTHHLYYYQANEFVNEVVEVRSLSTKVDSLIFMIRQLESYAASYISINNITSSDVDNLVLGYIRNLDLGYRDSGTIFESLIGTAFSLICGQFDLGFVDFVNAKESIKYTCINNSLVDMKSYFASFVSITANINPRYGTVLERFKMRNMLEDPVNNAYGIDLIHMFCSLDGLEQYPGGNLSIGYQLQNLIAFIGDLHSACYDFGLTGGLVTNFENQVLDSNTDFSRADFYADIDAYNIGRGYLTTYDANSNRCNLVSGALAAYYESCVDSEPFRYRSFIKNVAYQYVADPIDTGAGAFVATDLNTTGINAFRFTTANACLLSPTNLADASLDLPSIDPRDYFLCHPYSLEGEYHMPSYAVRKNMVKGFINFVTSEAGYGNIY
ncbi:MAG: hypothetical protein NTV44_00800 [Firmicutes bacterium]|nr:hypothetical protein [Bacillota bacterium]